MALSEPRPQPECLVVYGALRSGSTMLRLMLDAHPQMVCTGEHDFLFDHLRGPQLQHDAAALAANRIYRASPVKLPAGVGAEAALAGFVAAMRARGGLPVLMLHRNLALARRLLPGAAWLHLLRDPRDVAGSAVAMLWAGNVHHGADTWLATERAWDGDAGALTLRYEALLSDPPAALARVCGHVGLPYDPRMLEYPRHSSYAAPDAALAEQWRRKLSPREVQLVEARVGGLLAARGYAPSGLPPVVLSAPARARLWLDHKLRMWRAQARVYGAGALLMERAGRRLGLPWLQRAGSRRIEAVVLSRLK